MGAELGSLLRVELCKTTRRAATLWGGGVALPRTRRRGPAHMRTCMHIMAGLAEMAGFKV